MPANQKTDTLIYTPQADTNTTASYAEAVTNEDGVGPIKKKKPCKKQETAMFISCNEEEEVESQFRNIKSNEPHSLS